MAAVDINVPDFDFSGFYYGEILDALIVYKRNNIPEISNESPFEPGIQLLRSFALVGHLNNTLLDMTAQETMLPTAKLRDSVVNLLALLGYVPAANRPSTAILRAQLTTTFASSTLVVTDNAIFGTRRRSTAAPVLFEADAAITIDRTDQFSEVYRAEVGASVVTWTDYTTEANAAAGSFFFCAAKNEQLYLAHSNVMTDAIEFEFASVVDIGDNQAGTFPVALLWEFNDGSREDATPDSVANIGAKLRFYINDLLGTSEYRGEDFAWATVNQTGVQEEARIYWDPTFGNYIDTGFLGQTTPRTDPNDYTVGKYWKEITGVTDTTKATRPVVAEAFDTGDTILTTFTSTLLRWPLEPDTEVEFSYLSGAVSKTATWETGDVLTGDAATGTTVDPETGVATLVATSTPDAGPITVSYTRKAQPFQQDGIVSFKVPKTVSEGWVVGDLTEILHDDDVLLLPDFVVPSTPAGDRYWLRCRHLGEGYGQALGSGFEISRMHYDSGGLFIEIPVTQGRTIVEVAGSGDGTADQSYDLDSSPVIEGSVLVTVDTIPWVQVDDFSAADSTDQAYAVRVNSDGVASVSFGDGVSGKPPPVGTNNITVEYRIGGAEDGNVGADQIRVNRTGLSRIKAVTNPEAAFGWVQQEGANETTLEKLKRDGVASIRVLERAVTTSDIETLAVNWAYSVTNQRPFSRAKAIENGFGLNTVKLLLVPIGGAVPTGTAMKSALDDYYNGNEDVGGDEPGVLIVNHELTSEDYSPLSVDVTATVTGGNKEAIETALENLLTPEATRSDGITYVWEFGGLLGRNKLIATIFAADQDVEDVAMSIPAADITLDVDELPVAGTISITMVP